MQALFRPAAIYMYISTSSFIIIHAQVKLMYRHPLLSVKFIVHTTNINCQYYYTLSLTCPDMTDIGGKTPLDVAVEYGHTEVVDYLKSLQKPSTSELGMCVLYRIPYHRPPFSVHKRDWAYFCEWRGVTRKYAHEILTASYRGLY